MKFNLLAILLFFIGELLLAQISPPGLGRANTANWLAFGIRQELDTIRDKGWQSMTYIGMGRKSNPDNQNPLYKPGIFVLNQEFYHQFHHNWQYSLALSYRRQNEYLDTPPYKDNTPNMQQEFRLYGRFSYILKSPRVKLVPTLRQDFRKYYTTNFKNTNEIFQVRSRLRLQVTINLDRKKSHRIIASSEQLFSSTELSGSNKLGNFNYKESRFLLYYSYSPQTIPLIVNIGYMNNLVGQQKFYDVHYLAFDIMLENPFKLKQR
ncbi:MAG: DUF2490 domain-containing protein, partial [Bacteroidia bacterium]|nr:DUF2490 domain-containing protein [Bacteroidia bacterium]